MRISNEVIDDLTLRTGLLWEPLPLGEILAARTHDGIDILIGSERCARAGLVRVSARLDDEAQAVEEVVTVEESGWTIEQWVQAVDEALILLRAMCP